VGSTFHDIEGFFEIEHRIKSKLPKGIKIVLLELYRNAVFAMKP
jgi:hypothetical protein